LFFKVIFSREKNLISPHFKQNGFFFILSILVSNFVFQKKNRFSKKTMTLSHQMSISSHSSSATLATSYRSRSDSGGSSSTPPPTFTSDQGEQKRIIRVLRIRRRRGGGIQTNKPATRIGGNSIYC